MKQLITKLQAWLNAHPQWQKWLWFIGLWCAGLLSVSLLAYLLRWVVRLGM
jgi:uncharacterized protein involved in cysteine biosynthesis